MTLPPLTLMSATVFASRKTSANSGHSTTILGCFSYADCFVYTSDCGGDECYSGNRDCSGKVGQVVIFHHIQVSLPPQPCLATRLVNVREGGKWTRLFCHQLTIALSSAKTMETASGTPMTLQIASVFCSLPALMSSLLTARAAFLGTDSVKKVLLHELP